MKMEPNHISTHMANLGIIISRDTFVNFLPSTGSLKEHMRSFVSDLAQEWCNKWLPGYISSIFRSSLRGCVFGCVLGHCFSIEYVRRKRKLRSGRSWFQLSFFSKWLKPQPIRSEFLFSTALLSKIKVPRHALSTSYFDQKSAVGTIIATIYTWWYQLFPK